MKNKLRFFRTALSIFMLLCLATTNISPSLAQEPDPGGSSSEQTPITPAQPLEQSVWGQPGSPQPRQPYDPNKVYLAANWGDDHIHFLDAALNSTGSFATGLTSPNGVAANDTYIYVGSWYDESISVFDYSGSFQYSWTSADLYSLLSLELVNGEVAAYSDGVILFYDPSGTFLRSIPSSSAEGMAFDGSLLWTLGSSITALAPATGTVVRTIPNPAIGCDYSGTGMAYEPPGVLLIACNNGEWFRASIVDGTVLESGNNGLYMYGLSTTSDFQMHAAYVRSTVGAPWGGTTNESIMDSVFGATNWMDLRYETLVPQDLFSGNTNVIFMEGSDSNADELEAFLASNQTLLENWVEAGGCLLLNAAPNEGNGMSYGFGGVVLSYDDLSTFSVTATAADPTHPMFTGPWTPVGISFSGGSFAHASVSGGGVTNILLGNDDNIPLAELAWGEGLALFGGMTLVAFHDPQPEATHLRANTLHYLVSSGCQIHFPAQAIDDGVVFFEDFENGFAHWAMDGLWNPESQEDTCGSMVSPFPSPTHAAYYGQDGICNYDTLYNTGSLTLMEPIVIPTGLFGRPYLFFSSYEETECSSDDCPFDYRYVEISTDGMNWHTIGMMNNLDHAWYKAGFDLSPYIGIPFLLRFRFDSTDDEFNEFFGWMIDDISIINLSLDSDSQIITPDVRSNDYVYTPPLTIVSYDDSDLLGTLSQVGDGKFGYDPNGMLDSLQEGETAVESFSYTVSDGVITDTARVYIAVIGVNDPPESLPDSYSTLVNSTLDVPSPGFLGNDLDPEGDLFWGELVEDPWYGALIFNPSGSFQYTPESGFGGQDTFSYVAVDDGGLQSNQKQVKVNFGEPEFVLGTVVHGTTVSTLFGDPIAPMEFEFQVGGSPSTDASFTWIGPNSGLNVTSPWIEGDITGLLTIDLGVNTQYAQFGYVLGCSTTIIGGVTATAIDESGSTVEEFIVDAVVPEGYIFAQNQVRMETDVPFRYIQVDFNDTCMRFIFDNLSYMIDFDPSLVTINVGYQIYLPLLRKAP